MRYLVNLEYDGSNYYGWAKQNNKNTIQGHLEDKLSKIFNEKILIYGSGRTDKGVHALDQYFHFDSKLLINLKNLKCALNNLTNKDINIKKISFVTNEFHSRFNVKYKTYLYIFNDKKNDIFKEKYQYYYKDKINIKNLQKIFNEYIGEHDFLSFTTSTSKNTIREIRWIKIERKNNEVHIKINANGFLKHMVRMLIGYSLLIYENKKDFDTIKNLLKNPQKGKSSYKILPNGLYLYRVYY